MARVPGGDELNVARQIDDNSDTDEEPSMEKHQATIATVKKLLAIVTRHRLDALSGEQWRRGARALRSIRAAGTTRGVNADTWNDFLAWRRTPNHGDTREGTCRNRILGRHYT